jgi:exodeoxyribonuclease VIII
VLKPMNDGPPAKAKAIMDAPHKRGEALRIGGAVDCLYFEPDRFEGAYEVPEPGEKAWPNAPCAACGAAPLAPCTTKKGEVAKRCCAGRNAAKVAGVKEVLSWEEWQLVQALVLRLRTDARVRTMFDTTKHQVSMVWEDAVSGLLCKGRLDMVAPGRYLADLKTCEGGKAAPALWPAHAWKWGYAIQAAFYHDGWLALTGEDLPWLWVAEEKDAPHLIAVYQAEPAWIIRGRDAYRRALRTYTECLASGEWPGYDDGGDPVICSPPTWLPIIEAPDGSWM